MINITKQWNVLILQVANTTVECIPSHDGYVRRTTVFLFIHRIFLFVSTMHIAKYVPKIRRTLVSITQLYQNPCRCTKKSTGKHLQFKVNYKIANGLALKCFCTIQYLRTRNIIASTETWMATT